MKGGKDMTKTYTMFNEKEQYTIKDGDIVLLEIKKSTLNLDGKKVYENMFSSFKKGDKIKIKKDKSFDKKDKFENIVYENVKEIIEKIVDDINNSDDIA